MASKRLTRIICFSISAFLVSPSWANGLDDLKNALKQLNEPALFSAQVQASISSINSEGGDKTHKEGSTSFQIAQTPQGLQIHYDNNVLQQIDLESQAKRKDPTAKTPITNAMNRFNYTELNTLLYPLQSLEQDLEKAVFKNEEASTFQGKPARLLNFTVPLKNLNQEERKNLKHFKAHLKIWIDENGIPLASHSKGKGSGRLMLVIGFEFHFDVHKTYTTLGKRLITTELNHRNGGSGAGMSGDETITATLAILP